MRLVYKGVRYSEDLDFVLKQKDEVFFKGIAKRLSFLPSYVDKFIPFAKEIRLKTQKDSPTIKRLTLSMQVETFVARDRTNIEIVSVPSYNNQAVIISQDDLPVNPAILVETPQEIFSDKFVAFGSRDYMKGRDVWDIFFILKTLKIVADNNEEVKKMCYKKIFDYGMKPGEFIAKFNKNCLLLEKKGPAILEGEMDKFLPISYRNLYKAKYKVICKEVLKEFLALVKTLEK